MAADQAPGSASPIPTVNEIMLRVRDENLVGLWDSGPYDYGSMESSWLCLRGDGTGWTGWANAAGGASVSHLTWSCPLEGEVELRYTWTVSGSGSPGTPPTLVEIDEEGPDDTLVRTRFTVGIDTPPLTGPPVTSLHLDDSVECARRFALLAREVDPAIPQRPPRGAGRRADIGADRPRTAPGSITGAGRTIG